MIDNISTSMSRIDQMNTEAKLKAAQDAKEAKEDAKLKEACKGFEAMFLNMMYREMRNTVPKNELFGNSNADDILRDMLDTQMVDNIADGGGVGLADMLYKQLKFDAKGKADMAQRHFNKSDNNKESLDIKA